MVSSLWRFANVIERRRHGVTRIFTGGLDVSSVAARVPCVAGSAGHRSRRARDGRAEPRQRRGCLTEWSRRACMKRRRRDAASDHCQRTY